MEHVHDVVGVGFGPSNLALAIALDERPEPLETVFFERQPQFGWHRGMLLEGATMQVSFLKDLVTMRSPGSGFSFLTYLKERDRLLDFINHKTMFPSRLEFHDYLEWAAAPFADVVEYGSEVTGVEESGDHLAVTVRSAGAETTHLTRNLVIAAGLTPVLPEGVTRGGRMWHSDEFLDRLPGLTAPGRVIVVGAGQSAAEVAGHLHGVFPETEVCAVFTKYGYTPADDSSFANRIFDPEAVDDYFGAPAEVKGMLNTYHASTNYSAVDLDLIDELYRRHYQEKVSGRERLRILNASRLLEVADDGDGVKATVRFLPTGEETVLDADLVVFCTGYRPSDPLALLGDLRERCERLPGGAAKVGRDYRIVTRDLRPGIYVQGATEHTHGLTSTLLSNTAVRVGEIAESIAARAAVPVR